MKLLRLKITDPAGFRSLPCGFEHHFRTEWSLQDELAQPDAFAHIVCAGPNGSGKSNLYRALRLLAETAQGGVVNALAREGGLESSF